MNDQIVHHFDQLIAQAERNLKRCVERRGFESWIRHARIKSALAHGKNQAERRARGAEDVQQ